MGLICTSMPNTSKQATYFKEVDLPYPIDLQETAFSGQTFLWHPGTKSNNDTNYLNGNEEEWMWTPALPSETETGKPEIVWVVQLDSLEKARIASTGELKENWLANRFDLTLDIESEFEEFQESVNLPEGYDIEKFSKYIGLASDPPLYSLLQFICSQQMNVNRIHDIFWNIAKETESFYEDSNYLTLPSIEDIIKTDLSEAGLGYREEYIEKTAKAILENNPELPAVDSPQKDSLLEYHGVGKKVADCVLLYGYNVYTTIPVDTWMKTVAAAYRGVPEEEMTTSTAEKILREQFRSGKEGIDQMIFFRYSIQESNQ